MVMTKPQSSTILTRLGFRVNTNARYSEALRNFQRGWNLGPLLANDGVLGPNTDAALRLSELRRSRGLGTASANFSFTEVRCKCSGSFADCDRIWTPRSVFSALEKSRIYVGRSISVTSGCRCPNYNARVGGAPESRHKAGDAIDWRGTDKDVVKMWKVWRGIGYGKQSDCSLHTDLRPTSTVSNPMTWVYPGW